MELTKGHLIPENSQVTDDVVVERVLGGEKELYELLMRRHNQKLYRVVRSYLPKEQEAEDCMQDTYLKAFEKLYQFNKNALFSTWLIQIGINVALGKLRENKKLQPFKTIGISTDDYQILQIPEPSRINPERIAINGEVRKLLEEAIDSIPEKYRIVFMLREIEDMNINEITQCLAISESNVKVRLHRAKSMLQERLYTLSITQEVFEFGFQRCDRLVERVMAAL